MTGDLFDGLRASTAFCPGFVSFAPGVRTILIHRLSTLSAFLLFLGFLMAGIAMTLLVCGSKKAALAVAPPLFTGTALFLVMMVLGFGFICTCLSILSVRI